MDDRQSTPSEKFKRIAGLAFKLKMSKNCIWNRKLFKNFVTFCIQKTGKLLNPFNAFSVRSQRKLKRHNLLLEKQVSIFIFVPTASSKYVNHLYISIKTRD